MPVGRLRIGLDGVAQGFNVSRLLATGPHGLDTLIDKARGNIGAATGQSSRERCRIAKGRRALLTREPRQEFAVDLAVLRVLQSERADAGRRRVRHRGGHIGLVLLRGLLLGL